MIWGATPEEWVHFGTVLGLAEDLLPVVSNPQATISDQSKMKSLGKTPSVYNKSGAVIGIPEWTQRRTTAEEVAKWSCKSDYGICLQTRRVRALDIDVEDEAKARAIANAITLCLGDIPIRFRKDIGKCLFAFQLEGELPKRIMKVDGGIIEFLANGQQFVAIGTHPSGARYEWDWAGYSNFPSFTIEEFEATWNELVKVFAIESPSEGGLRNPRDVDQQYTNDDTYKHLWSSALGVGSEGQLFIECPWKDGHSSDSGITECAYFPAGGRGYEQGHFKCLHASCAKRTDDDFMDALGVAAADFEVIEERTYDDKLGESTVSLSDTASGSNSNAIVPFRPHMLKRNKAGIMPVLNNVLMALRSPDFCGLDFRYDTFRDQIVAQPTGGKWREFEDADYVRLRSSLETRGFVGINPSDIKAGVLLVAGERRFDSALEWLRSQEWDGVPRMGTFLERYWGVEGGDYSRAVSRYMWTALAGRVLEPGVKADMVPIMQGDEGLYKSSAVEAIAPMPELFCEIKLNDTDETNARKMRGKLVVEINELSGLHTRAREEIWAFIVRRNEQWVPKYKEFTSTYSRRCLLIGTANPEELLNPGKNRRFLPFAVAGEIDIAGLRRDVKQLWAEARETFELIGIDWMEAQRLAPAEHEKFMMVDETWEQAVNEWLNGTGLGGAPRAQDGVRISDILVEALAFNRGEVTARDERRVREILKKLGYTTRSVWKNGKVERAWVLGVR